jgi:hypothetical protein
VIWRWRIWPWRKGSSETIDWLQDVRVIRPDEYGTTAKCMAPSCRALPSQKIIREVAGYYELDCGHLIRYRGNGWSLPEGDATGGWCAPVFGDPCPVCGKDGWPAGSAGNARRIHELAEHEGDPRIEPRWAF